MPQTGPIMHDSEGNLVPGSAGYGAGAAQEETPAAKKRRVEKSWNDKYFAHLGYTGIGGAAKVEAYKVANPTWTKARDKWAQGVDAAAKAAKAAKPKPRFGATLGELAERK